MPMSEVIVFWFLISIVIFCLADLAGLLLFVLLRAGRATAFAASHLRRRRRQGRVTRWRLAVHEWAEIFWTGSPR